MAPLTDCFDERSAIQHLHDLLPIELRLRVKIVPSVAVKPPLICTKQTQKHGFTVEIDRVRWLKLAADQQDLLFWHEVGRIQTKTVSQGGWELPVIFTGLGFALVEVSAQNVISLAAALVAVALASHQLYQRKCGERSLRETVVADRCAIQLATTFGYSFSDAARSLANALKILTQSTRQPNKQKYQVRLRALEIWVTEQEKRSQLHPDNLTVSWQY